MRGRTLPVVDLRLKFGLGKVAAAERSCIVVLETGQGGDVRMVGVAVDAVSEVLTIRSAQIDPTPRFGARIDTRHILAMAKAKDRICMLLDIDYVLREDDQLAVMASRAGRAHAA